MLSLHTSLPKKSILTYYSPCSGLKQDVDDTGLTFGKPNVLIFFNQHILTFVSPDEIKKGLFSKVPTTQLRMRLKQVANFDRSDEGELLSVV